MTWFRPGPCLLGSHCESSAGSEKTGPRQRVYGLIAVVSSETGTLKADRTTVQRMDWTVLERRPLLSWGVVAVSGTVALLVGILVAPRQVFDAFIWRYYWGPVVADATGNPCAQRIEGETVLGGDCTTGIVVTPGYTTFSTITFAIVLLFALVGVVLLMQRLNLRVDRGLFYSLIPFVFFGGSLRVVEDAHAHLFAETGEMVVGVLWIAFLISPLIYLTVFVLAAGTILGALQLEEQGVIRRYEYVVTVAGTAFFLATVVILAYLYVTTDLMDISLIVPIVTLGGATVITALVWWITEAYWPEVNHGTGLMGAVVIWGHTVDGIANVMSLDWATEIGLPRVYGPKHVVNRWIIETTTAIQPASLSETIGTAWPFLPVKVLVAVIVVWVFNDEIFEDSPSFAMLLLIAVLAVGLGPGTRDFLRATLGI